VDWKVTARNGEGTVIWFDEKAGCGFIKPNDGGPDLFARTLVDGARFATGGRVAYAFVTHDKQDRTEVFIRAAGAGSRIFNQLTSPLNKAR
jgi:cold shock CspA family protein